MREHSATTVRRDLAAAYRLLAHFGMDDSIYTHVSARLEPGSDRFLINPYGYRFEEVTPENLVTVDHAGNLLDDPLGMGINQAGFVIHSAIHEARADVHCVLHTHTLAGVALSCLEEGLLSLNQWSMEFHGRVGYHSFEGIALDLEERERLVADLGQHPILVLRNHGLLVCGRTVGEAFKRMYNLERSCQAQLAVLATGRPLSLPGTALAAHTAQQYVDWESHHAGADADPEWGAYLRMLARCYPDFVA